MVFDQVAKNADGKLTEAEFAAWAGQQQQQATQLLVVLNQADFGARGDWMLLGLVLYAGLVLV